MEDGNFSLAPEVSLFYFEYFFNEAIRELALKGTRFIIRFTRETNLTHTVDHARDNERQRRRVVREADGWEEHSTRVLGSIPVHFYKRKGIDMFLVPSSV